MKNFSTFYKRLIFKGLRQILARERTLTQAKLKIAKTLQKIFLKKFAVWKIGITIVLYSNANNNGKE